MNDPAGGESLVPKESTGNTLYKKDFWSKENLQYNRPHYRLEKSARIVNRLARGKKLALLDVGCGPAALMPLLQSNIEYYGIDIAIHDPAPNLIEADLANTPIRFDDKRFDIVIAQGFFEYMGTFQAQKFTEISQLLNDGGIFIVTYVNFGHRDKDIYWPYSNVQALNDFRQSLAQYFEIKRSFPTSYNWQHNEPNRKLIKAANKYLSNINFPFIGPVLAVEYFFICFKLSFPRRIATKGRKGVASEPIPTWLCLTELQYVNCPGKVTGARGACGGIRQVLSCAFARSPGARSVAWARLAFSAVPACSSRGRDLRLSAVLVALIGQGNQAGFLQFWRARPRSIPPSCRAPTPGAPPTPRDRQRRLWSGSYSGR